MERASSIITKEKILNAAEACFSVKGFDGTGIEEISQKSGTNKALIYYHFKNKEGLLLALYAQVLYEVEILVGKSLVGSEMNSRKEVEASIRAILQFLSGKSSLMKILLMESLKGGESEKVFLDMAGNLMKGELEQLDTGRHGDFKGNSARFLVFEFFTGFIPIYFYTVYGSNWSGHYGINQKEAEEYFIDSFIKSHLGHHNFEE